MINENIINKLICNQSTNFTRKQKKEITSYLCDESSEQVPLVRLLDFVAYYGAENLKFTFDYLTIENINEIIANEDYIPYGIELLAIYWRKKKSLTALQRATAIVNVVNNYSEINGISPSQFLSNMDGIFTTFNTEELVADIYYDGNSELSLIFYLAYKYWNKLSEKLKEKINGHMKEIVSYNFSATKMDIDLDEENFFKEFIDIFYVEDIMRFINEYYG